MVKLYENEQIKDAVLIDGYLVMIEFKKGDVKTGKNEKTGETWHRKYLVDYGYFKGIKGADGDSLDVYIKTEKKEDGNVYIVHALTPDGGRFDEDKVIVGCDNAGQAYKIWESHCHKPEVMFGGIDEFTSSEFKKIYAHMQKGGSGVIASEENFDKLKNKGLISDKINNLNNRNIDMKLEDLENKGSLVESFKASIKKNDCMTALVETSLKHAKPVSEVVKILVRESFLGENDDPTPEQIEKDVADFKKYEEKSSTLRSKSHLTQIEIKDLHFYVKEMHRIALSLKEYVKKNNLGSLRDFIYVRKPQVPAPAPAKADPKNIPAPVLLRVLDIGDNLIMARRDLLRYHESLYSYGVEKPSYVEPNSAEDDKLIKLIKERALRLIDEGNEIAALYKTTFAKLYKTSKENLEKARNDRITARGFQNPAAITSPKASNKGDDYIDFKRAKKPSFALA